MNDKKWYEFLENMENYGFKYGFSRKFEGYDEKSFWSSDGSVEETEVILHHQKGLLIYAQSNGTLLKSATVYGEIMCDKKLSSEMWDVLNGCSVQCNKNGTISFNIEVTDISSSKIDAISKFAIPQWKNQQFLWFLNYMETLEESVHYKRITKRKIALSTEEVHKIIGV